METEELPDPYLSERVRVQLATVVHELGLTVVVVGAARRALLSGSVATAARRDEVEVIVREMLPGYEVHNRVAVQPMAPPEREELM
jgi:osmotically-inducible protein OsmY